MALANLVRDPVSPQLRGAWGFGTKRNLRVDVISFSGDSSYATGGSDFKALLEAQIGKGRKVLGITAIDTNGYVLAYDEASGKLKMFASAGVQVTAATNLSATTFKVAVLSA